MFGLSGSDVKDLAQKWGPLSLVTAALLWFTLGALATSLDQTHEAHAAIAVQLTKQEATVSQLLTELKEIRAAQTLRDKQSLKYQQLGCLSSASDAQQRRQCLEVADVQ